MDPAEQTGSHSAVQIAVEKKDPDTLTLSKWTVGAVLTVSLGIGVPVGSYAVSVARDVGRAVERLDTIVTRVGLIEGRVASAQALELRVVANEQQTQLHRTLGERLEQRVLRVEQRLDELAAQHNR